MRGFRNVLRVLGILVVLGAMGLIVSALVLILDGQDASGIETVQATKGLGRFFWAGIVASIGLTLLLTSFLDQAARTRSPGRPVLILVVGLLGLWSLVTVLGSVELSTSMSAPTPEDPEGKFTDTGGVLMLVGCGGFLPLAALVSPIVLLCLRAVSTDSDRGGDEEAFVS